MTFLWGQVWFQGPVSDPDLKEWLVPIYAYRCASCGHEKDVLQKMSDPILTDCPSCGQSTFEKQVTAAGFQLKGTGWYVTDFRGGSGQQGDSAGASESASTGTSSDTSGSASTSSTTDA